MHLHRRETGQCSPAAFSAVVAASNLSSLRLSSRSFARSAGNGGLLCLALEAEGEALLLAGGSDGGVTLHDTSGVEGGEPLLRLRRGPEAHAYACTALGWYPDGAALFFSCGLDGSARGYDAASGAGLLRFGGGGGGARDGLLSLALPRSRAASHGLLACGAADGRVRLFDPAAGGGAHELRGHSDAVLALAWLPGAEHCLASGGAEGALKVWDVRCGGCLHSFDQAGGGGGRRSAHTGPLLALAAAGDGALLFSLGADGRVRRWDARNGEQQLMHCSLGAPPASAAAAAGPRLGCALALSACGRVLFAPLPPQARQLSGGAAALCARTGARLGTLAGGHHGGCVRALALRRDGSRLFSAGQDGCVRLWSSEPSTRRAPLPPGEPPGGWEGERADEDEWDVVEEEARGPRMGYRAA